MADASTPSNMEDDTSAACKKWKEDHPCAMPLMLCIAAITESQCMSISKAWSRITWHHFTTIPEAWDIFQTWQPLWPFIQEWEVPFMWREYSTFIRHDGYPGLHAIVQMAVLLPNLKVMSIPTMEDYDAMIIVCRAAKARGKHIRFCLRYKTTRNTVFEHSFGEWARETETMLHPKTGKPLIVRTYL